MLKRAGDVTPVVTWLHGRNITRLQWTSGFSSLNAIAGGSGDAATGMQGEARATVFSTWHHIIALDEPKDSRGIIFYKLAPTALFLTPDFYHPIFVTGKKSVPLAYKPNTEGAVLDVCREAVDGIAGRFMMSVGNRDRSSK